MHPFHVVKRDEIDNADSLEQYIKQQLGVGYVTAKDGVVYRKKINEFFEQYPAADWSTLVKVVDWAKSKKRRYDRLYKVIESVRYALADGCLPELVPDPEKDMDDAIHEALRSETDDNWRRRLLVAQGARAKEAALAEWVQVRGGLVK